MSRINTRVSEVYFTILPTRNSGFTDQLNQFDGMYRLGSHMGYRYFHTDLKSNRSKYNLLDRRSTLIAKITKKLQIASRILKSRFGIIRGFEVFDFIGFNQYLREIGAGPDFDNTEIIKLKITNEFLEYNNIDSLSDLTNYIRSSVQRKDCKKLLVVFDIKKGRKVLNIIYSALSQTSVGSGLRQKYYELKKNNRWSSKFNKKKELKIMVHVRQGDTSVIETPWNTYIPVFALYEYIEDQFAELEKREYLKTYKNIGVSDYYNFIQKITSDYGEDKFSILVFSDGFKRGFDRIYQNIDKLDLSNNQKTLLMKSEKDYNMRMFGVFKDLPCTETVVGEDSKKLMQLIHAFFDADIVVVGNQQSMIPKLLSVYCNIENMPIVVVLYRKILPRYLYVEEEILKKNFIFVDVENPEYSELSDFINLKIFGSPG